MKKQKYVIGKLNKISFFFFFEINFFYHDAIHFYSFRKKNYLDITNEN
jgi:hypothetical protein